MMSGVQARRDLEGVVHRVFPEITRANAEGPVWMSTWNSIVGPGSMRDIMFDLIGQAERERGGRDRSDAGSLSVQPAEQRPLEDLREVRPRPWHSWRAALRDRGPRDQGDLEQRDSRRPSRAAQPAFDFAVWREKMALVEGRVCRVEIGGNAAGTGFLVGPDAVLTNYHVLESVLKGTSPPDKVTCRFDYKVLADGSRVEGVAVGLHPTDWKLDFSPFSAAEKTGTPDTPPPSPEELDYAFVRLRTRLGDVTGGPQGWVRGPAARVVDSGLRGARRSSRRCR